MNEMTFIIAILAFLVVVVLTGRFFYKRAVIGETLRLTRRLDFDLSKLVYSYDQMIYFISLPTTLPDVKEAAKEALIIEQDYESLFFPALKGIKIHLLHQGQKLFLAYLPIENFRLPYLDKLHQQGLIDEVAYNKISVSKLLHPATLEDVREEVYKQLQVGRY